MRQISTPLTVCTLLLTGAAAALSQQQTEYTLFVAEGADAEQVAADARKHLPKDSVLSICTVPTECHTAEDAQKQAQALYSGVTHLPSLAMADKEGPYAVLPLNAVSRESIQAAQVHASAQERKQTEQKRDMKARIFLVCAYLGGKQEPNDDQLETIIRECRDLLQHPAAQEEHKQFIGYRCLYPALMLQYKRGYTGAHTPYTEAKLLEAIAALEAARDVNRETKLGKQAFAERERLRKARREARKYE